MTITAVTTTGLAPDPDLPHRDTLLDDGLVAQRLARLLDHDGSSGVVSAVRTRAKYRIGESLRATFEVRVDGVDGLVSARMFAAGTATSQLSRTASMAGCAVTGNHPTVLVDPSADTVFWVFPKDRKLVGLDALVSPPEQLRDAFGAAWTRSQLLAYSPEKAATARCLSDGGGTLGYAKVQLGDEGLRSIAVLRAVSAGVGGQEALRLPSVVGYVPEHHMALYGAAPGRPLTELPAAQVPLAMAALGRALSVLHRQPVGDLPVFARLLPSRLTRAGELIGEARPDVADEVRLLVAALLLEVPSPTDTVLLHGDVHPKNVLVHSAGVSLVDLDQAAAGPAAAELGGLLARLWCPRGRAGLSQSTGSAAVRALLASYGGRVERRDMRWYAAAALLVERALRAVNRVDAEGLLELPSVLATARRWAENPEGAWT
jgi:aminoglycoside phosphotransferase